MTAATSERPTEAGWVLFDDQCGVCSRWVPFWAPTLRRLGLGIAPLQDPWVSKRCGLDADTLSRDLRLLHADGRMTSGADVYRYVMRRVWWARPFYVLSVAPVGRHTFDWGYRTFAQHRRRISSACRITPRPHRKAP